MSGDTAQLHLSQELQSRYDWWGPVDSNNYGLLDAFITANEYDSSLMSFYNGGVLSTPTWQKVIIFAEGSTGQTSGTLIEIDRETNEILTTDAGSWYIENITDNDGNTYDIIVAEPILCGYEKRIFRLDGSTIMQGQRDEAGVIGAELGLGSSLKDKLADYFISNAPLDIDPSNPNSPEITESMLSGKVFYTVNNKNDGTKEFSEITVDSPFVITQRSILVDGIGNILDEGTGTIDYYLENGGIVIESENINIWLNADPLGGDWNVTIAGWNWMDQEMWLLTPPIDFPQ